MGYGRHAGYAAQSVDGEVDMSHVDTKSGGVWVNNYYQYNMVLHCYGRYKI